jgi:glycosyltransferase A (GT-A) superfamily protein (DUF2064 family)
MHLTVIAKEPRAGFVKTRLCPPCTPEQAAEVAAAALSDTLDAVDEFVAVAADAWYGAIEPVLLFDGDASEWTRPGYTVVAQRGDGLAARLGNAFDELGPGLIVGMEAPVAVQALGGAVAALRAGVDVLGLAVDGGYWVIGLHRVDPAVFDGVPMSTSHTGLAQLARMRALGRPVRMLRMEHDLDTVDDLRRIAEQAGPARPGSLRETARSVVRQLG